MFCFFFFFFRRCFHRLCSCCPFLPGHLEISGRQIFFGSHLKRWAEKNALLTQPSERTLKKKPFERLIFPTKYVIPKS